MEKKMEKFYTNFLLWEIRREIKKQSEKEEKNVFIFIKIYVIAMKIVEKKEEQNCFYKKKDIIFSDYLVNLYKNIMQRILSYNFFIDKEFILL